MKLPVKTGPSRKDPVNGGEYRVLMDSAGAWLADVRSEHTEQIVTALNASPTEADQRTIAAMQAKIDALMLEYCPDEMTPEQIDNWKLHQVVAGGIVVKNCKFYKDESPGIVLDTSPPISKEKP